VLAKRLVASFDFRPVCHSSATPPSPMDVLYARVLIDIAASKVSGAAADVMVSWHSCQAPKDAPHATSRMIRAARQWPIVGQGPQQPVGEVDQVASLAGGPIQARVGRAASWPGSGGHGAAFPWPRLPSPVRQDSAPECEAAAPPHNRAGCLVVLL
jgi:hypothetical protein